MRIRIVRFIRTNPDSPSSAACRSGLQGVSLTTAAKRTGLSRRAERLTAGELGPRYPVGRLVDGAVMGAALGRQQPLYAEGLEHQVDLGVVELAAAVRVEYLDVRDREGGRRERRLDRPGVLSGPGGVADDPPCCGGRRAGGRSSTRPRRTRRPGRRIYGCAAPCRRGRARRRSARRPR